MHFRLTLLFLLYTANACPQLLNRDTVSITARDKINSPLSDDPRIDSIRSLISSSTSDSARVDLMEELGWVYRQDRMMDSAIAAYKRAYELNRKIGYSLRKQVEVLGTIDYMLYEIGNYTESLEYATEEMRISEELKDPLHACFVHLVFGHSYKGLGENRLALDEYFKARNCFIEQYTLSKKKIDNAFTDLCIAQVYLKMEEADSALIFAEKGYDYAAKNSIGGVILLSIRVFGDIYHAKGNDSLALFYYRQYIPGYVTYHEKNRDLGYVLNNIATIFHQKGIPDSATWYAQKALDNALKFNDQENIFYASKLLAGQYAGKDDHKAFNYLQTAFAARESMLGIEKVKQAQILAYREQVRQKQNAIIAAGEALKRKQILYIFAAVVFVAGFLIWNRIRQLRLKYKLILEQKEAEQLRINYEKQIVTLEAMALRAQMNPHFIFNCMNSIKSLMQQNENDKAITYLTTFSKLLRTILQNSDKREISLYDEIETCQLYTRLEGLRFGSKLTCRFNIDESIDLKSIQVPAMIIQPFIENSIWHGMIPKADKGTLDISVKRNGEDICCIIEDDGIGREMSRMNKFQGAFSSHESKGVSLTQSRLDIDNFLNERNTTVEITDKKDDSGNAAGTRVTLTFITS